MPRAFLITSRRYDATGEFEDDGREYSPEHAVRLGEYSCNGSTHQATSDGASECASEESSSECPEELYNLTKLAEVSLAAAAGTLVHPTSLRRCNQSESERSGFIELKPRRLQLDEDDNLLIQTELSYPDEYKSEDTILPPTPPTTSPTTPTQDKSSSDQIQESQTQQQQQQQESGEDHECPDCGKRYSTSSNLARHRQTHRSLGDKKARRCPHCDKVYVSIPAFSMHVRTHNQGCKCHYCGKCFSRPWLLQGHIRTHTGEKPFKCTICNKAFADKSNLRAHIQTHSNTKPHVCSRCGKAFALKSYLYKHEESSCMRAHHPQRDSQKRETPTSNKTSSPASSPQATASPTSVIVPPRSSACPAVIQHTRTTPERNDPATSEMLSRMVIRTSVISPNPEHLARFAEKRQILQQTTQLPQAPTGQSFDFNDPTRLSAFSRPQPMSLSLAIA